MSGPAVLPIEIHFAVTESVKRFVCVYAILGEKVYLVDTGVATAFDEIAAALQKAGRSMQEVGGILLTHAHPDQIGCAAKIKMAAPQCRVHIAAAERDWLADLDVQFQQRPIPNFHQLAGSPVDPDVLVRPGDHLYLEENIKIQVLDCAGHSHGSVGYYWAEQKVLFTGDAIPAAGDAPIFASLGESLDTLRRLQGLRDVAWVYSAWEEPACGEAFGGMLAGAARLLTGLASAVSGVCGDPAAGFLSTEETCDRICEAAGLWEHRGHPLFTASLLSALREYYGELLDSTCAHLQRRGFRAVVCADAQEATNTAASMLDALQPGSVGFGNSQSVRLCGIPELAEGRGCLVFRHDPRNFSPQEDRRALLADLYFTSANALSAEGHLVNIDGTGNRVGATCFGPTQVVYLVGRNKIVSGLEAAMDRAKQAAVHLAAFYGRNTPCAQTGRCHDCLAPECVCGVTTIHRKALAGNAITVILVNENMGL